MRRALRLLLMPAVVLSGCGSYRVLAEAKTGGTVALEGAHDRAREKAEGYMRAQCPGGYEVVEEGEAASEGGGSREWRLSYRCTGSGTPRSALIAL